jgi:ribosome biogenesis GTPase A
MGIGCPSYLNKGSNSQGLPVLNMAVLGYPKSGKSTLIKQLGLDK